MCGFCCCPCPEDFEEYAHPNNPIYRQCLCLRYFFHQLFTGYNTAFQRLESRAGTGMGQQVNPLNINPSNPTSSDNTSPLSESYHLVPRPLPFSHLVSRREKSSSAVHAQEESQPLRKNGSSSGISTGTGTDMKKRNSTDSDAESGKIRRTGSDKVFGSGFVEHGSEDEDVCPTCLEEYNTENPKIIAKCSHHYHLSCIYEWMERSDNCPICGKEMEFFESP